MVRGCSWLGEDVTETPVGIVVAATVTVCVTGVLDVPTESTTVSVTV